ncbi:DUF4269 domain-containing protein [Christiangramia crocea]|uniref:DUF4269 domain-containing protein n=1 Tax=Christiangramia crocea TaxID=2904124 RepID=A0A9X1UYJ7_9FLAO|nr:DUF4269 domain-containing protein [Gramella crocea]MCG9972772.1 DUF4269 domain-containing protein [Gramella crocea]
MAAGKYARKRKMREDFKNIEYLKTGNSKQKEVYRILKDNLILEKLAKYSPILVGTIPIRIDIENSDLDIICFSRNLEKFETDVKANFSKENQFMISIKNINKRKSVVAKFRLENYDFEIFGQNIPTDQQDAFLHMIKENEILKNRDTEFRRSIIELKRSGLKTEPAFAKLLDIKGDPYSGLLNY